MENSSKTSDVLNRAADLIEERGWVQGCQGMSTDVRELCLEGAVRLAFDGDTTTDGSTLHYLDSAPCPAGKAVTRYLGMRPYVWNDHPARTAAEVIEFLRATAVIEAARENADERVEVSA